MFATCQQPGDAISRPLLPERELLVCRKTIGKALDRLRQVDELFRFAKFRLKRTTSFEGNSSSDQDTFVRQSLTWSSGNECFVYGVFQP